MFDTFRREYNHERPHEALGQVPPSTLFERSPRRYPRPLLRVTTDAPWNRRLRINKHGRLCWDDRHIFLSTALAHEDVELRYEYDHWDVVFGALSIGLLRERDGRMEFKPSKGRLIDRREVSGMSSD
jgi:putative transposase